MSPYQVYRMPIGQLLHSPSCRVTLKVIGVERNTDCPALLVRAVGQSGRPRRATVAQSNAFHLADECTR